MVLALSISPVGIVGYSPLASTPGAIDWIINNQLGKRNVTPEQASYLRGRKYNREKQAHGGQIPGTREQNVPSIKDTAEALAEHFKVSDMTIKRDGQFAEAVDKIAETVGY